MAEDDIEDTVLDDAEEVELVVESDGEPLPITDADVTLDAESESDVGDREYSGSFTVEVEDEEMFTSLVAGEVFESGMSMELADDLDDLLTESDAEFVPPPTDFIPPDVSPEVVDELEVDRDTAETLLKVIYQKLDDFRAEYGALPEKLVLGLPQFKTVEAYTRHKNDEGVERRLPVDEVIVVPGPQIHCVRDPYAMVEDDLEPEADSDE